MDRIEFTAANMTEALRPTHALQVAAEIGGREITGQVLATACETVRDRYRCRTVRTELRRTRLLGEAAGDAPIGIACNDQAALQAFEEARRAA